MSLNVSYSDYLKTLIYLYCVMFIDVFTKFVNFVIKRS